MKISDIETADPEALAPVLLTLLQRLGQLGRNGAIALARLVEEDDADVEEALEWLADIAAGSLRE
ncbi:hypothetical protein KNJ79_20050 [Sphingopyxis indica]|uniref:hypothetical protein n=1 Tax=Sphingopyxis indica TaxID=436663 RepID=UPI002938CF3C|nr:hypothetical protein [Sphingopyxis indica]MEA3390578.1 hypothetical protein [Pseudomonadota bacterium]WOF43357.1 hypothetical protein KNJ79_20050 [Sphingopyxis indica]